MTTPTTKPLPSRAEEVASEIVACIREYGDGMCCARPNPREAKAAFEEIGRNINTISAGLTHAGDSSECIMGLIRKYGTTMHFIGMHSDPQNTLALALTLKAQDLLKEIERCIHEACGITFKDDNDND